MNFNRSVWNTFNGWKQLGRVVAAGERSSYRNEYGDKMFHKSQTVCRGCRGFCC